MNSEAQENQQLVQQVERLQREIRFMKRWAAVTGIALLALIVGLRASDHHRVSTQQVVTKGLVLIDSESRARVRVAGFPEGSEMESCAASDERHAQLLGDGGQAATNLCIPVRAEREVAAVNLFRDDVLLSFTRRSSGATRLAMQSQPKNARLRLGGF